MGGGFGGHDFLGVSPVRSASPVSAVQFSGDAKARLRYLLALLAKEIAQRTHGVPGSEAALESLVEILAHAERNLRGG